MYQTCQKLFTAACVAAATATAGAATITESESNNTLATADPLPPDDFNFVMATLGGTGGDVDVFSIFLNAGDILLSQTVPLRVFPNEPDTELAIVNSSGTIVEESDDTGDDDSRGDALDFMAPTSDTYFVAVTGFPDGGSTGDTFGAGNYEGGHSQSGRYALTTTIIPVPEPLAGIGGLAVVGLLGLRRGRA